jgi:hypothetical protein
MSQTPQPEQIGRRPSAWWFVIILLVMFFLLMVSHIGVLWVGVLKCNQFADLRMQQYQVMQDRLAASKPVPEEIRPASICVALAKDFNDVARLYLATILALLSGAGFSAGTVWQVSAPPKDEKGSESS